jgi:hypothetical protein
MSGSQARSHHEDKADVTERDLFAAVSKMIHSYLTGDLRRAETGHFVDELQRLIEERYPNPGQLDCPNIEYLVQLTSGSNVCESTIEHVTRCAPCFRKCADLLDRKPT